ncbi:13624_t:CDS:1, partial [Racocetra persica]
QQYLNQKSAKYNEAKRLFIGLTDFDYKPGHTEHTFYKYWLASNDHASLANKNDTVLLDTYQPEEIHSQYIVQVARKDYTVIDYPSKVYGIPDAHEYIDGNQLLHLVIDIDVKQKPDPSDLKLSSLDNEKINREDLIS